MAFMWTKEKIEFFKEASVYTGFHGELGKIIGPYLDKSWTLCDLGCGLGMLDFAIAKYVKEIIAVDSSKIALDDYKARLASCTINNIKPELADINEDFKGSWDAVLLSFFGKPGEELDRIFSMANKEVIIITYLEPQSEKHIKLPESDNRPTTSDHEDFLKKRGFEYKLILREMDFGQPFRSLDSARSYFEAYSRECAKVKRDELIQNSLKRIKPADDAEFPYFLPKKRDVGIFIVKCSS